MAIDLVQVSGEHDINDLKCMLSVVLVLLECGLLNFICLPGTVVVVSSGNLGSNWCYRLFPFADSPGLILLLGLNNVGISLIRVGIRAFG